jgi:hypothetical protein
VRRHPCHCYGMAAAPARTGACQATAPALWSVWERDATLLTTVVRTGRRQQLPRAYQKTSQPPAALLPSEPPLLGYKIGHDGRIAARIVRTDAHSTA